MAKLRITLPKEFSDFCYSRNQKWTAEDIKKCKELLTPCDPNARERGYYKQTALHYYIPFEIAEWLIERGADVNIKNSYGTPIFKHANMGNYDICKLFIEHRADINIEDYAGKTALFSAADGGNRDIIKLLLEHGADPCHRSSSFNDGLTPLLYMLSRIDFAPDDKNADTAELLVKAQREHGGIPNDEWQKAQDYIAKIGHKFELYKNDRKEYCAKHQSAMDRLYKMFNVEPAAQVIKHDGKSPITINENLSVYEQHQALWNTLCRQAENA